MPRNSASSSLETPYPLVFPPPGFMPGALYIVIIEKAIQSTIPDDPSPPTLVKSLGFFYQEHATMPPISSIKTEPYLQGNYWSLLPEREPRKGTMPVYNALHHQDVLGYIRVAERVNPRSLPTLIEADDKKIQSMEQMTPEIYVFNALERLRRHGFFEANMGLWNLERFVAEINYFRHEWRNVGFGDIWHCPRPFADFPLIFFNTQVHWLPSDA